VFHREEVCLKETIPILKKKRIPDVIRGGKKKDLRINLGEIDEEKKSNGYPKHRHLWAE